MAILEAITVPYQVHTEIAKRLRRPFRLDGP
jgi:hypothetical protein